MRISLAILLAAFLSGGAEVRAQSDDDIYDLIDALQPLADAIKIDGQPGDWLGMPHWEDAVEFPLDPALDIVSTAIAAQPDALILLAELAGAPLSIDATYSVAFDFGFNTFPEILLFLNPVTGTHSLLVFDDEASLVASAGITGIPLAFGTNHFELSIPYTALIPHMPVAIADALLPANHRSFVRASVSSYTGASVRLDDSAPVASYRLINTPYPLDPPLPQGLPNSAGPPIEMAFPLADQWAVLQGAGDSFSHSGQWAWDWLRVDREFKTSDPAESLLNEDYFGFGEPLYSPVNGVVTTAVGNHPDNVPGTTGGNANVIQIDLGPQSLRLLHHRQGSVSVSATDIVTSGTQIAEIGNSGFSAQPHLHLDVLGGGSHRVSHTNVLVSLNPGGDDPWVRFVSSWEPRVGFLAEAALPVAVPSIEGLGGLFLVGALVLIGILIPPDQHVAWRGNAPPADALAVIDRVRGAAQ